MGLILGAAVLLVFLLIIQMTGGSSREHSELSQLREELENRKKALTSNNSLYSPPGETPENLAARLSSDSARLASREQTIGSGGSAAVTLPRLTAWMCDMNEMR